MLLGRCPTRPALAATGSPLYLQAPPLVEEGGLADCNVMWVIFLAAQVCVDMMNQIYLGK
jgi:hypothetical protein